MTLKPDSSASATVKSRPQRILWLSWKDRQHPAAGGAEVVMHEIVKRLVADGHHVTILTAGYGGAPGREVLDGAQVVRVGRNRYLHSFKALLHYLLHMRNQFDVVVEVVNTAPYFAALFPGKAKPVLFYHQLAREIWYFETKWPLNYIGYHVLETAATKLLSKAKATTLSVSNSTTQDLLGFGFDAKKIRHISEGIHLQPLGSLDKTSSQKYAQPTLLSLGALRAMKRTLDQVKAFEIAKRTMPGLRLIIAGSSAGDYGQKVLAAIANSPFTKDIEYLGKVSHERKQELMQRSSALLMTSLKEGWGLVVSEANSQGTPAIVYDVDGLRDSVRDGQTGIICQATPQALARGIHGLLADPIGYEKIRRQAYEWSHSITFDQSYADFRRAVL